MENKKAPQIRFSGFSDAWEQRKFSEIFDFLQNNTLSRAELNNQDGKTLNVHYGDVLIKFNEYIDIQNSELPFITDDYIAENFLHAKLKNGDVIFADTAEDETVGKCVEISNIGTIPIVSGLHTMPCRPKLDFAEYYLGFYLNSNSYHNQLLPLMQGIKVTSISKSAIENTVIKFPKSLAEQARIGAFFRKLDDAITLHQRKCEKLKKIKSACLKAMFV